MDRISIHVDAGYLFAQGSAALVGKKQPQSLLDLDDAALLNEFSAVARDKAGEHPLLRVYWYDTERVFRGPVSRKCGSHIWIILN